MHCCTNSSGTQKCFLTLRKYSQWSCPDNVPRWASYTASAYFFSSCPCSEPGDLVWKFQGSGLCGTSATLLRQLIWARLQNKVRKVHLSSSWIQLYEDSDSFYKYCPTFHKSVIYFQKVATILLCDGAETTILCRNRGTYRMLFSGRQKANHWTNWHSLVAPIRCRRSAFQ